jgi:hypothetical protein
MRYKVLKCVDETGDSQFVGHVGLYTGKEPHGMLELLFHDWYGNELLEYYWPEELELVQPKEPDWEV